MIKNRQSVVGFLLIGTLLLGKGHKINAQMDLPLPQPKSGLTESEILKALPGFLERWGRRSAQSENCPDIALILDLAANFLNQMRDKKGKDEDFQQAEKALASATKIVNENCPPVGEEVPVKKRIAQSRKNFRQAITASL